MNVIDRPNDLVSHAELTEEQRAIVEVASAFAADEIAPHARRWEDEGTMPRELWRAAGELGLAALFVSPERGGTGLSRHDGTLVFEAIARACPSVAAFLSIHNMCAWMIDRYGSVELRDAWLEPACRGEKIISYCLTEPGSGSDAAALRTRAERSNSGWALSGTKAFISGGGYSDAYIVMCRTGDDSPRGISAILIEDGAPGLTFGKPEEKMGWRAQPTAEVQMDGVHAPATHLLGDEGRGFTYAMAGLDGGRLNIAACALGGAAAALDKSLAYMRDRRAFGQRLDEFQALQFRLADMETELEAARALLSRAAHKLDAGTADATRTCAMAKRFVTDTAFRVANDALQLHGGYGYLADYGVEKIVRDLRVHQILEGTNEVMRVIIARSLIAEERG
ncbi:MAG: acyl-CoA dehydrogenase family protein [Pseudomonadota bacterium]